MKQYYSRLIPLMLILLGISCSKESNQVALEEPKEEVEVSPSSTPLSFALSLTPDALEGGARALSYTIDREAMTIKGSPLPEKPLNAIVAISTGDLPVYGIGKATFSKVPGKNIFYCDDVRIDESKYEGVSVEGDEFRLYYPQSSSSGFRRKSFKAKYIYARAFFTYEGVIKNDPPLRGYYFKLKPNWGNGGRSPKSKFQVSGYNLGVPYIMEDVKLEVKDGRVQVVEGEKPQIRPFGSMLFVRLRNTTTNPIKIGEINSLDAFFGYPAGEMWFGNGWPAPPYWFEGGRDREDQRFLPNPPSSFGDNDRFYRSASNSIAYLEPGEVATYMFWIFKEHKSKPISLKIPVTFNWRGSRSQKSIEWISPRPVRNGRVIKANIDIRE